MQPLWKQVHAWTEAAVFNLETTDFLLRQATARLAAAYQADCLLWAGFAANQGQRKSVQVFASDRVAETLQQTQQFTSQLTSSSHTSRVQGITCLTPVRLPNVIQQLQRQPQLLRLPTGDLVVPWISGGHVALPNVSTLQFVLQLQRSPQHPTQSTAIADAVPRSELRSSANLSASQSARSETDFQFDWSATGQPIESVEQLKPWTTEEIRSLEVIGKSLILAYQALFWRERLEQSRHRTALVGRVTQLINSRLNPSQVIQRLVDELGQDVRCDCLVLLDMRGSEVRQLATWPAAPADQADAASPSAPVGTAASADAPMNTPTPAAHSVPLTFPPEPSAQTLWQDVIDMFTQGGASYLELDLNQPQISDLSVWLSQLGAVQVLIVPLFVQTEFFGCFLLLSQHARISYPLEQLQTIRQVADQTAIALINARYYVSLPHQDTLLFPDYAAAPEGNQDSLTGLMTRRALNQELDNLSTPTLWVIQQPFAILFGDLDYFQILNATYGHTVGDEVLQKVAERLRSQLRQGTSAYRYGGEEFVIVLTDTIPNAAVDVAERLRHTIRSRPFTTSAGDVKVTISFGIAYQDPVIDTDASTVMQRAEQALKQAKYQGRDRVVLA